MNGLRGAPDIDAQRVAIAKQAGMAYGLSMKRPKTMKALFVAFFTIVSDMHIDAMPTVLQLNRLTVNAPLCAINRQPYLAHTHDMFPSNQIVQPLPHNLTEDRSSVYDWCLLMKDIPKLEKVVQLSGEILRLMIGTTDSWHGTLCRKHAPVAFLETLRLLAFETRPDLCLRSVRKFRVDFETLDFLSGEETIADFALRVQDVALKLRCECLALDGYNRSNGPSNRRILEQVTYALEGWDAPALEPLRVLAAKFNGLLSNNATITATHVKDVLSELIEYHAKTLHVAAEVKRRVRHRNSPVRRLKAAPTARWNDMMLLDPLDDGKATVPASTSSSDATALMVSKVPHCTVNAIPPAVWYSDTLGVCSGKCCGLPPNEEYFTHGDPLFRQCSVCGSAEHLSQTCPSPKVTPRLKDNGCMKLPRGDDRYELAHRTDKEKPVFAQKRANRQAHKSSRPGVKAKRKREEAEHEKRARHAAKVSRESGVLHDRFTASQRAVAVRANDTSLPPKSTLPLLHGPGTLQGINKCYAALGGTVRITGQEDPGIAMVFPAAPDDGAFVPAYTAHRHQAFPPDAGDMPSTFARWADFAARSMLLVHGHSTTSVTVITTTVIAAVVRKPAACGRAFAGSWNLPGSVVWNMCTTSVLLLLALNLWLKDAHALHELRTFSSSSMMLLTMVPPPPQWPVMHSLAVIASAAAIGGTICCFDVLCARLRWRRAPDGGIPRPLTGTLCDIGMPACIAVMVGGICSSAAYLMPPAFSWSTFWTAIISVVTTLWGTASAHVKVNMGIVLSLLPMQVACVFHGLPIPGYNATAWLLIIILGIAVLVVIYRPVDGAQDGHIVVLPHYIPGEFFCFPVDGAAPRLPKHMSEQTRKLMEDRIRAGVQTAEIRRDGRTILDMTTRIVYDSLEEFQVKVLRSQHTINMYDYNHPEVRLHGQCIEDHCHLAPVQVVTQGAVAGDPLAGVHGAPRWAPILTVQAMRRTRTGYAFLMVVAIITLLVHSADGAAVAPINSRYTNPSPIGWGSPPMEAHGSIVISQMIAGMVIITLIYHLMLENNRKLVGRDTLRLIGTILHRKPDTPAEHGGGAVDDDGSNNTEQQMVNVDKLLIQQARLRSFEEDTRRTPSAPSTATPDIDIEGQQQLVDELTAPAISWRSVSDLPQRHTMITKIVNLLQQRKPNAPAWVGKLPEIARRLEDSLYHTASSAEAYGNFGTLKHRLQQLALSMGARAATKSASGPKVSNEVSIDVSYDIPDGTSNGVSNDVDERSKPPNYRCRFAEDKVHGGSVTAPGGSILPSKRGLGSAVVHIHGRRCDTQQERKPIELTSKQLADFRSKGYLVVSDESDSDSARNKRNRAEGFSPVSDVSDSDGTHNKSKDRQSPTSGNDDFSQVLGNGITSAEGSAEVVTDEPDGARIAAPHGKVPSRLGFSAIHNPPSAANIVATLAATCATTVDAAGADASSDQLILGAAAV